MGKVVEERENGTIRVHTVNDEPSRTDTSWQDECDVNCIIERYHKTGHVSHSASRTGAYLDVVGMQDLPETIMKIRKAEEDFMRLTPEVRKVFNNDMTQMSAWLSDPKNDEEAVKLGLKNWKKGAEPKIKVGPAKPPAESNAVGGGSGGSSDIGSGSSDPGGS